MPPTKPKPEDIDAAVWEIYIFLRKRRVELNLTQLDLMRMTGLSQQVITGYETGSKGISLVTLCKIAVALNIKLSISSEGFGWTYN